jgi:hypothetical protein
MISEFSTVMSVILSFGSASLSEGNAASGALWIYWGPVIGATLSGTGLLAGEVFWFASRHFLVDAILLGVLALLLGAITLALVVWTLKTRIKRRLGPTQ